MLAQHSSDSKHITTCNCTIHGNAIVPHSIPWDHALEPQQQLMWLIQAFLNEICFQSTRIVLVPPHGQQPQRQHLGLPGDSPG